MMGVNERSALEVSDEERQRIYEECWAKGGFSLISWGEKFWMSNNFFNHFVDEAYGLVDVDWLVATGRTPLGITLTELDAQMAPLKGAPPPGFTPPGG